MKLYRVTYIRDNGISKKLIEYADYLTEGDAVENAVKAATLNAAMKATIYKMEATPIKEVSLSKHVQELGG